MIQSNENVWGFVDKFVLQVNAMTQQLLVQEAMHASSLKTSDDDESLDRGQVLKKNWRIVKMKNK